MPNESIRLPSGEVSSSVHYQKTIALSKTLNSTPGRQRVNQIATKTPRDLLLLSRIAGSTWHRFSFLFLFRFGSADSKVGQFAQRRHPATDV